MITITDKAIAALTKEAAAHNKDNMCVRVGIRANGCLGFAYSIQYDNKAKDTDILLTYGDLLVIIDPKSLTYLKGSVLDYEERLLKKGFIFTNPAEDKSCGCGKSFSIKKDK